MKTPEKNKWRLAGLLLLLLLIAYGRFVWPAYVSQGDWFYPNPQRGLFFTSWLPLFSPLTLNGYLGWALYGSILNSLFNYLVVVWHWSLPIVTTLLYFLPAIAVPAIGMWQLARRISDRPRVAFLASLLFIINGFVVTLLRGGQIPGVIAYGIIPWAALFLDQLLLEPRWPAMVGLSIALALQGIYEPRYLLITALVLGIWIAGRGIKGGKRTITLVLLAVSVALLLSAYWIYGTFGVAGTPTIPPSYSSDTWLAVLSYATVWHTLLLHHVWWPQATSATAPLWYFAIFPLGALLAWKQSNKRLVAALSLIAFIGIYLAKGINPPGGEGYRWLFLHLPGFSGFRDPAKFFTLIAFAYALLFAWGIDWWLTRWKIWRGVVVATWIVLGGVWLVGFWPLWSQRVSGAFLKDKQPANEVNQYLAHLPDAGDWYRTFWLPGTYRYLSALPSHPVIIVNDTSTNRLQELRDRLYGLDYWLTNKLGESYVPYMLRSIGVRYLVLPGDIKHEVYQQSDPLSQAEMEKRVLSLGIFDRTDQVNDLFGQKTYFLHLPDSQPRVYTTKQLVVVDRPDDRLLPTMTSQNPQENTLIWADTVTPKSNGYDQAFAVAQKALLHPRSNFNGKKAELTFIVPTPGSYKLWLPSSEASYQLLLNGQSITAGTERFLNGETWRSYLIDVEKAGEQHLQLVLDDLLASQAAVSLSSVGQWSPCQSAAISYLTLMDERENRQALSGKSVADPFTNTPVNTRCWQATWSGTPAPGYLLIKGQTTNNDSTAYLYINFRPQEDLRLPLDRLTSWQLVTAPLRPIDQTVVATILPAGEQKKLQLTNLWIYQLDAWWAQPEILLEPATDLADRPTPAITTVGSDFAGLKITVPKNDQGLLLVVNNEYHPGWQLRRQTDGKLVEGHFSTLLEQNAWSLPVGTEGELTLEFSPTSKVRTAGYISLITFLGLITSLVYYYRRRKKVGRMRRQ